MDEKEYRKQIAELLIKNREMGSYITILETKVNDLESELYFIKRNKLNLSIFLSYNTSYIII